MMKKMNCEKGFTLIELMIVVAIMGILAAIAIPQFGAFRVKASNSGSLSDVKNYESSQVIFYEDNDEFGVSGTEKAPGLITGASEKSALTDGKIFMKIGLSNKVSLYGVVDKPTVGGPQTFTVAAKHFKGDKIFGADSDITAKYVKAGSKDAILVVGNTPKSTTGVDFTDTLGWKMK